MRKPTFPKSLRSKNRRVYNWRNKINIIHAGWVYTRAYGDSIGIPISKIDKVKKGDILEVRGKITRGTNIALYQKEPQLKFLKVMGVRRFEYFDGLKGPFVMALIQFKFLDNLLVITEIQKLRTKNKKKVKHVSI